MKVLYKVRVAVNGTVNDLAMCGAMPSLLSLAFIIEERLPFVDFEKILYSIQRVWELFMYRPALPHRDCRLAKGGTYAFG